MRPARAAVWIAALAAVATAMIVPWLVRKSVQIGSPIALSANSGYNLRVGHAPYASGRYLLPADLWKAEPGLTFHDRETLFNDQGTRRAINYAVHHPMRELSLSARKIMWLWRPDSDSLQWASSFGATPLPSRAWEPLRLLLDASYLTILALAAVALVRMRRAVRRIVVPVGLVTAWTGLHVVFFGEPRYHLPMLTMLVPMAASTILSLAVTVTTVIRRLPARRLRP